MIDVYRIRHHQAFTRFLTIFITFVFLLGTVLPVNSVVPAVKGDNNVVMKSAAGQPTTEQLSELPAELQAEPPTEPPAEPPVEDQKSKLIEEKLPIMIHPETKPMDTITINGQTAKVRAGELIVRYKQENSPKLSGITMQSVELRDDEALGDDLNVVYASPDLGLEEALELLRQDPNVLFAEPNYEFYAQANPNDPMYDADQWGLKEIEAVSAWEYGQSFLTNNQAEAVPVKIAVLDTGIDSSHEDLADRVVTGYNALNGSSLTDDDSSNSHGTHVAGIAAAATNNNLGMAGTAGTYPVEILPVKVLDAAGVGSMLAVAQGIDWAVANGAKVINLSLGARLPDYPQTLAKAVKDAQDAGVLIIAAAGNEGAYIEGFYPACLPGVISVGASGTDHKPAKFSNYTATITAPGVGIKSTLKDNSYGEMSGTSAAAPFVAGTAALLRSVAADKTLFEYTKALQRGYKQYGYSYPYYYVFNARTALSNLLYPSATGSYAEIVQPTDGGYVQGIVDITVKIYDPTQTSKVEFTLYDESNNNSDGILLESVESFPESGLIDLSWDTSDVIDGRYTLDVHWYDLDSYRYYADSITFVIANDNSGGLTLQINKPDGTPAAGAKVLAFHAIKDNSTGKYQLQYEPGYNNYVYNGKADLQGRVILPAIDAISGNDFLVIAQGTEPNFLYHELFHAPGEYTLDKSQQVKVTAGKVGGQPLPGALLLTDLLDVEAEEYYVESGVISEILLAQLNALGQGDIWLTPGQYEFRIASVADGYYLHKTLAIAENAGPLEINLAPQANEVASLRLLPTGEFSETGIQLRDDQARAFIGFDRVDTNKLLTITPDTYTPIIEMVKRDNENNKQWHLELTAPVFTVLANDIKVINFGGSIESQIENDASYPGYWLINGYAYFKAGFYDDYGNKATYLSYQAANAAGLAQSAADPATTIIKQVAGSVPSGANEQETVNKPEQTRLLAFDPVVGSFEPMARGGTEVNPKVEIRDNNGTLLETRMAWFPYCTSNWSVGNSPAGTYQAIARLEAGVYAADGAAITSTPLLFEVKAGEAQPPEPEEAELTVTVVDYAGEPVAGARITLMGKTGDGYSPLEYWDDQFTGGTGQVFYDYLEGDYAEYALGVYGAGRLNNDESATEEQFFVFVPQISGEGPLAVTINLAESPMHRLQIRPRNESGNSFTHRLDFSISGQDSSGAAGEMWLTYSENAELPIWVREGTYTAKVASRPQAAPSSLPLIQYEEEPSYWGPPLYLLSGQVEVTAADDTDISLNLGGTGLVSVTPEIDSSLVKGNISEYAVGGLAFYQTGQAVATPFFPQTNQPIYLQPGDYRANAVLVRMHHDSSVNSWRNEGIWDYWLEKDISLAAGSGNTVWPMDDAFTASIATADIYQGGEILQATHLIEDGQGNRLTAMGLGIYLGGGWNNGYSASIPVQPQNHEEVAPFLVIQSPDGQEIYRAKEAQPNFGMLQSWEEGRQVRALVPTTSFYRGNYQIPDEILGGQYKARLELGIGPDHMITAEKSFTISNDTAAPILNPLPELTNQAKITVTGTAAPEASVVISYRVGQGQPVDLEEVIALANGSFSIEVTLPAQDGSYSFTARSTKGDVTSSDSQPVTILVDRTAPAAPGGFKGTVEDANHITLSWDAAPEPDISYFRLSRNGTALVDVPASSARSYLDSGLAAETEYIYTIVGVDKAGNISSAAEITIKTSQTTDNIPPIAPAQPTQVIYRPGGQADIYWQPTTDNIRVDSYKIFRSVVGGVPEERGSVKADQLLEFHDVGLLAETVYSYTIKAYDEAGNESEPSPAYELTTSSMEIYSVSLRLNSQGGRLDIGLVNPGGELTIRLSGEKSRQASAEVAYLSMLDENNNLLESPRVVTTTVDLTENQASPGNYQGIFIVPQEATEITNIQGKLTDGAAHYAQPKAAPNLPLQAAGVLTVEIDSPDLAALEGYQIYVWSPTTQQGGTKTITAATAVYEFTTLKPAADYSIKIRNNYSRLKANQEDINVKSGQPNNIKLTPVPQATLKVQVLDPGGGTISGIRVSFRNMSTNHSSWGLTGDDGKVVCDLDVIEGETVEAIVALMDDYKLLPYYNWEKQEFSLSGGENNRAINLRPFPKGTVSGTIKLDTTGESLGGIVVTATQVVEGRSFTTTTTSSADGRFTLEALAGSATLSASSVSSKYIMSEKTITISAVTPLSMDLVLSELGKANIDVTILSKYIDREETIIRGMDWWTAAHFNLTAKGPTGQVCGSYPLNLLGRPGETIKVSINGREAGLPVQEQAVVLDDARHGEAIFQLIEQGRITGTVRDYEGRIIDSSNLFSLSSVDAYLLDENGRTSYASNSYNQIGDEGEFSLSVPQPGNYILKFSYDPYFLDYVNYWNISCLRQTATVGPVTVNQYQIRDIGDVKLSYYDVGVRGSITSSPEEASPNGLLNLRAEFSLDPTWPTISMKNAILTLELPAECELITGSVTMNGQELVPSGFDPLKISLGDIDLTKSDQIVVNCLVRLADPLQATQLIIPGSIEYSNGTMNFQKDLVAAQVKVSKLTINAPALLITPDTTLSGRGPVGAMVKVYDGTLLLGETQITAGGYWYLKASLPDKGSPVVHRLRAVTDWNGSELQSGEAEVTYDPDKPVLTEIRLKQGSGREVTFAPTDGIARFPYVIRPGDGGFNLTLKFNHPERVNNVEVSIPPFSREAEKVANGEYRTTINFSGYYLGGIYLKYETKEDPAKLRDAPPEVEELRNQLPLEFRDFTYEVDPEEIERPVDWPASEDCLSGAIDFTLPRRQDINGRIELTASTNISNYVPTAQDLQDAEETGIPVYGFKMGQPIISNGGKTFSVWVEGYIPQKYIDTSYPAMTAAGLDVVVHVGGKISFTSGQAFNAADWSMSLKDGFGVPSKFDELAKMVDKAAGCGSLSNMYRDQIDHLANKLMGAEVAKWAMMAAGTVLGPETFGLGTLLMFGATKAMEYALDRSIDKSIADLKQQMAADDECENEEDDDKDDRDDDNNDRDDNDREKKKIADPKWIWDPSGNVYEAVLDNPLSGVRTTIYEQNDEGNMVLWDAEWYGQENPLYTGDNGYYGWDVPPGEWQVVYEKDGYDRAQSEVMSVPPPRTGVNVNMKNLTPPQLTAVAAAAGGSHVDINFDKYMLAATLSSGTISVTWAGEDGYEAVTGQVSGLDLVEDSQNTGVKLTKKARFTPDTPLTVGETYQVRINGVVQSYAGIALGTDQQQEVTVPAVVEPAGEVSGPQAIAGDGYITVVWTDPAAVNLEQIKLSWKPGGAEAYQGTMLLGKGVQTYTISGLTNGTEYEIKITTIDSLGTESAGVTVTGTPRYNGGNSGGGSAGQGSTVIPPSINNEITALLQGGSQQTVTGFNGSFLLNIPAGAFASGITLLVRMIDPSGQTVEQGLRFASQVFEINTGGTAPRSQVFLTLQFSLAGLGGIDPRQLGIYRQDDNDPARWVYMGGVVDSVNNSITVQLSGFSRYAVMANQPDFSDLTDHWARKDVEILASRWLVGGVGGGLFQPERAITRAEFANLLVKLAASDQARNIKIEASGTPSFTDVKPDDWYYAVVETAVHLGLVTGSNGSFRPSDPITRQEMAAMILRVLNTEQSGGSEGLTKLPFKDADDVSSWAMDSVIAVWGKGLMRGISNEYFQPQGTTTRAQAATVALRILERMGLIPVTTIKSGLLSISDIEGKHFELTGCAGDENTYILVPDSEEIKLLLESLAGEKVKVTGLLQQGVSQYMRGPVLRVDSVQKSSEPNG